MQAPTDLSAAPAALISIHDLMPRTMPAVRRTITLLEKTVRGPVTLLVVPGAGWNSDGVRELKALQRAGYRLAGHGWAHHTDFIVRPYHRLHSLLISRRVAEHLALNEDGIIGLINRCYDWFADNGLDAPTLYVPPAWAMGAVRAEHLADHCPFERYETFAGILSMPQGRLQGTALLGYEADRAWRAPIIRTWNAVNRARVRNGGLIRIGIHPDDSELRLRGDLLADLTRYARVVDYDAVGAAATMPVG
ncbi:MAG: polysaccharide deacetylase family protein [Thiohalocapsa sp.]|nr:polysaccharide deacetylase family protein [Thiohalocapsa sp.]MCF7992253.1 polysaccharide deacetylase family protein [Thiohalocapsa sp.]